MNRIESYRCVFMDLCVIFGNAPDNAIEASLKVVDPEKRSILVKCRQQSGNPIITFLNYYEGRVDRSGAFFRSSKGSPAHGPGMTNIQKALEKYNGTMSANTDVYHNFILTLIVPLP